jgi:hypothetical protein
VPKRTAKKEVKGLPTIKCACGAEILLVPDVKLMSKALEAHVEQHKKSSKQKTSKEAEEEAQAVMDDLVAKVLLKACET